MEPARVDDDTVLSFDRRLAGDKLAVTRLKSRRVGQRSQIPGDWAQMEIVQSEGSQCGNPLAGLLDQGARYEEGSPVVPIRVGPVVDGSVTRGVAQDRQQVQDLHPVHVAQAGSQL